MARRRYLCFPAIMLLASYSVLALSLSSCASSANPANSVTSGDSPSLTIVTTVLPPGTVGVSYTFALTGQGGVAPYSWKVSSGALPAGLQLGSSSGAISGTPAQAEQNNLTVEVVDSNQKSSTRAFTISIASAPATALLRITSTDAPSGTVGMAYNFALAAQGGIAPYAWSIASGTLPAGLALNSSTGDITGTPTQGGAQTVDVQVRDSVQASAWQSLSIIVNSSATAYTSYYIDSVAGNDTSDGTSSSTPWRTLAKINSARFSAGEHIFFKSGDIWRETLLPSSSGEAGNPIVFDAYGTGPAPILSGADLLPQSAWTLCSDCQSNIWRANVSTQPNIVLFNGTSGNQKTSLSSLASAGDWYSVSDVLYVWSSLNPGSYYLRPGVEAGSRSIVANLSALAYVTVQNLELTGANGIPTNGVIYAHTENGVPPHDLLLNNLVVSNGAGHGIHLEDCNNCVVEGSTIATMASDGISLVSLSRANPITSGSVVGNTVSNSNHDGIATYGCAIGGDCQGFTFANGVFLSGINISGNTVHDNGEGIYLQWTNHSSVSSNVAYHNTQTADNAAEGGGIELEASSNNTIERNLLYENRLNGVELSNDSGAGTGITGASNNLIQYNAVHDNGSHALFTDAAPTESNQFLYNLVWNQVNGECFIANGMGHTFYGNVCWHNSTGIDLYTSSSTPHTGNISIENNIIANSITRAVHIESGVSTSTVVFDHNNYDFGSGGGFLLFGTAYTLSGWQSASGFDAHSFAANPEFVSATPSVPADFVLQASSPDVGTGAALGSAFAHGLAPGSAWPSTVSTATQPAAWDIGAFIVP
jgi:parallel beta-helix repeat protein